MFAIDAFPRALHLAREFYEIRIKLWSLGGNQAAGQRVGTGFSPR
jgi:hypothetical protein